MVVFTGMYWFAVFAFRKELLNLMYGEKYAEFAYLLPYLISVPVITALGTGVQTGLRALQVPQVIFVGYCVTAIVTISFGVGLVRLWGLMAVVIGGLFGSGGMVMVVIWYWKGMFRGEKEASVSL
jgi:O-antigen/teichoic acid export membrane protein